MKIATDFNEVDAALSQQGAFDVVGTEVVVAEVPATGLGIVAEIGRVRAELERLELRKSELRVVLSRLLAEGEAQVKQFTTEMATVRKDMGW